MPDRIATTNRSALEYLKKKTQSFRFFFSKIMGNTILKKEHYPFDQFLLYLKIGVIVPH